jgi:outer membrane biosynthesis protein TonB
LTLTPGNDYHSLHMTGLWADGWFYISSAGLLVSGILFFFLLGQYRAASEAADADDGVEAEAESPAHEPVAPVMVREEKAPEPAPARVASVESKPAETPAYAGPDRRKDPANTTGGLSPAVVYLQNIKLELDEIHKEMRALAKRVDDELGGVASRDEALIERLADLTRSVEALKTSVPASAPAAAPEPQPEPKPEPVVEAPKPKAEKPAPKPKAEPKPPLELSMPEAVPAPKTEPVAEAPKPAPSPDETIRMELGNLISPTPAPAPAPADAPAAEPAPEEKPRRGPVWPV